MTSVHRVSLEPSTTVEPENSVSDLYQTYLGDESLLHSDWFLFATASGIVLFMEIPVLFLMFRVRCRTHFHKSLLANFVFVGLFACNLTTVFFDFATDVVQLTRILLISSEQYCGAAKALEDLDSATSRAHAIIHTKSLRAFALASTTLVLFLAAVTLTFSCSSRIWAEQQCRGSTILPRMSLLLSYIAIFTLGIVSIVQGLSLSSWDIVCDNESVQHQKYYGALGAIATILGVSVLGTMRQLLFPSKGPRKYVNQVAEEAWQLVFLPWQICRPVDDNPSSYKFIFLVLLGAVTVPIIACWTMLIFIVLVSSALGIALCLSDGEVVVDTLLDLEVISTRGDGPWDFSKILGVLWTDVSRHSSSDGITPTHRRFVILHAFEFSVMTGLQLYFLIDQVGKPTVFDWVSFGFSLYMISLPVLTAVWYGRSFATSLHNQLIQPWDRSSMLWFIL